MITPDTLSSGLQGQVYQDSPVIAVRDVTMRFPLAKRYREWLFSPLRPRRVSTALTNISLSVQTGDRIAVMGPNGAGKTTLLKLIGGLIFPTQGEVAVNGFSTQHNNAQARKSVGFVFNEERSFFWRLSGAQNLEFFGTLDNLSGSALRGRIQYLIHLVGLDHAEDRPVSAYSSGMKQRLALARVLIAEPDVLILDEPTRALDPVACDEIVDLILADIYKDSRKTLLIATHRTEEALTLCNKVMVIDHGRLKAFDSIADITADGTTLLQYYRQSMLSEGNHEASLP
ncbi:ABC transporter ATP-binding protein [Acidobacterium sp. S8]|uniref:ABC transporter ATP-binding protein n=1 Tax=Acidobacterium sp. S8 TaxID=1641854 RepID=UPI00131CEB6F|nr:ABC transporter ATP-binding protein [Acidobacterium sp. S8]